MKDIKNKADQIRKKGIVEMVNSELERRAEERMPYELQWRLNICFEKGDQYCDVAPLSKQIYNMDKQYYWQEREVFNHIAPIVEARLSRLSQLTPLMTVRPSSSDESDRQNAMLSRDMLHSVYYRLDMPRLIKEATQWSELCGSSFYKVAWDREASAGKVKCGDVSVEVCPPFEIFPDSCSAKEVEDCRSIIRCRIVPVSLVEQAYSVKVKPAVSNLLASGMMASQDIKDCVTLAEYYQMPDAEHKN